MAKNASKRVEKKYVSSEQTAKTGLRFKLTDSYASLVLGIVMVIVVIALGTTMMKMSSSKPQIQDTSSTSTVNEEALRSQRTIYTIQEGDSLSTLAQKYYGDGEKWILLAKENKIIDADNLEPGMKINIPLGESTKGVAGSNDTRKIEDKTYTVVEGDFLWDIAVRAYGDGYRWVDIATANGLHTPDAITSGMTLKLPR